MHLLFGQDRPEHVSLGNSLLREEINSFLSLLQEFSDIFAWSHVDMSGVFPTMAQQYLNLQKESKSIHHKLRRFHPSC